MRTLFVLENDTHPFLSRPVATVTEALSFVWRNLRWVGGGQAGEGARLTPLRLLGPSPPHSHLPLCPSPTPSPRLSRSFLWGEGDRVN